MNNDVNNERLTTQQEIELMRDKIAHYQGLIRRNMIEQASMDHQNHEYEMMIQDFEVDLFDLEQELMESALDEAAE